MFGSMARNSTSFISAQSPAPSVRPVSMNSLGTRRASSATSSTSWKKVPIHKQRDLGALADAEPDQRERHQRRHRQIADEVDQRLGGRADRAIAAHQHAERDRDRRRRQERDPDPRDADADVGQIVVLEQALPSVQHRERRGQELRVDQAALGHQQPGAEHGREGGDPDPELDVGSDRAPGSGTGRARGRPGAAGGGGVGRRARGVGGGARRVRLVAADEAEGGHASSAPGARLRRCSTLTASPSAPAR